MDNSKIIDITNDVKWTGIFDHDLVTFDIVMETKHGTTYNSYFINAEKKTIIETAKKTYKDAFLGKIQTLTDPSEIAYIVLNHTEPDHSGSLKYLLEIAPNATVVGSGQALNYLGEMIGKPFKSLKVKDGDELDLGNKTLKFIGAPNLHWPDSMYTWLEEDKILFTCDSFGAHYCKEEMFDDLVGNYDDAFKYYFDVILKPYSKFMLKAIEKIRPLPISMIGTGHGPILRRDWKKYVDLSEKYATEYLNDTGSIKDGVLVAYISAYGFTRQMAEHVARGISENGSIKVDLVDIENILPGDLEQKIAVNNGILVGSPTFNQNTLLPVYKLFALVNPIRDKGKLAGSFGSYGWSGEAVNLIDSNLRNLKLNVFRDGLSEKFYPHSDKAEKFYEFGKEFARVMAEKE